MDSATTHSPLSATLPTGAHPRWRGRFAVPPAPDPGGGDGGLAEADAGVVGGDPGVDQDPEAVLLQTGDRPLQ